MIWRLALCALATAVPAGAASPRTQLDQALAAYQDGDYDGAALTFGDAARSAEQTRLDPAVARYDQGCALLAAGRYSDAQTSFQAALRTSDLTLQQQAYYNRGNALYGYGERLASGNAHGPAMEAIAQAVVLFANAIELDPQDLDAKVNYEVARERLESMREEQQRSDGDAGSDDSPPREGDPPGRGPSDGSATSPDGSPNGEGSGSASPGMTREEAEMLLDAMREEEQAARASTRPRFGSGEPLEKDW